MVEFVDVAAALGQLECVCVCGGGGGGGGDEVRGLYVWVLPVLRCHLNDHSL